MSLDLRTIARATGGIVQGRQVLCPGPGHSRIDRSLSVRLSHQSPTGFITHSYVGDDFTLCRDHVAAKLGLGPDAWKRNQDRSVYNIHGSVLGQRTDLVSNIHEVEPDNAARVARARAIWDGAGPATGSIVETYLASRGLALNLVDIVHEVIRFHPRCPWRDEAAGVTIYVPAMVAALRQIQGDEITGVHRTRLTNEGAKVDRRMLGLASGAAIKLDADDVVTMGLAIGEGIETVMQGRQLGFRPGWALGSAGGIKTFPVLGGVEALTILAESDATNARAVEACAARWHGAGRDVTIIEPASGSDLNDAARCA